MAPLIRHLCLATLPVGLALALAACGSSSNSSARPAAVQADNGEDAKPGPQVLKDAAAAMTASGAVHIVAVGTQGKPPQKLTEDGHVQSDGLVVSMKSAAGESEFIAIDKTGYVKNSGTDGSGSTLPAPFGKKYANRWLKLSADSSSGSGTSGSSFSFTDDDPTLASFDKSLSHPEGGVTINSKVTKGTLNGQPVVLVTESDGSLFTVAAVGKPYVLKAVLSAAKNTEFAGAGTLTLSDYGQRVVIQAPANAVDLGALFKQIPDVPFPSSLPSGFPTDFPKS